jgi:type I restriction enzyme S subunit
MGRGRKPDLIISSEWEIVFYNSVGTYVQYINLQLSKKIESEPLSNHIKILGGYAFKSTEYKTQGIPIIRISDFSNERIVLKDVVHYKESKELDKYELKEGDIIIALTGGTIAKLGIVQKGIGKLYLNQRVGKFEALYPNEFESEYVYWIARSVQSIIKNLAWGAAIPNVSPKQIEELSFPIPEKKVQRKIINFLNDLKNNSLSSEEYFDKNIELHIYELQIKQLSGNSISTELTHQQDLVKQLRQAFLREAMQGKLVKQSRLLSGKKDGHAKDLLEKIKNEKNKLISEKKIKKEKELSPIKPEEIPFEIPENWVWCRLGEISSNIEYGTSEKADLNPENTPVLRMNNIQNGILDYENLKYVKRTIPDLPKLYLKNKDLLFNRTNSWELVGKSGVYHGKDDVMTFASYLIRIQFEYSINVDFINAYINSSLCRTTQLEPEIIQQNGQANFNGTKLKNIICPLPPINEQNRIVKKLEELMSFCDALQNKIQNSQQQNQQLLQQVLREALEK